MKKVPHKPNLALKVVETVSASKQKLYTCNQKESKRLNKNPDRNPFRQRVEKTHSHFFHFIYFSLDKIYNDAPLNNSFPKIPNLLNC